MNNAAGDVKGEPEQPENHQQDDERPQHWQFPPQAAPHAFAHDLKGNWNASGI
jgi:hypothetical protein